MMGSIQSTLRGEMASHSVVPSELLQVMKASISQGIAEGAGVGAEVAKGGSTLPFVGVTLGVSVGLDVGLLVGLRVG